MRGEEGEEEQDGSNVGLELEQRTKLGQGVEGEEDGWRGEVVQGQPRKLERQHRCCVPHRLGQSRSRRWFRSRDGEHWKVREQGQVQGALA